MDLTKWEPVGGLIRWKPAFCGLDEIVVGGDRMLTTSLFEKPASGERLTKIDWRPCVDIEETGAAYRIEIDLSGVKKEDVKLTIEGRSVVLRGERHREHGKNEARLHRTERPYGTFSRSFTLPFDADETKISAELLDGSLKVHVPKSPDVTRKAIEVRIG